MQFSVIIPTLNESENIDGLLTRLLALQFSSESYEIIFPERARMTVIPNGVDATFFHPIPGELTHDLLFTGNMNYPPNIDSVLYLVNKVLPLVRRERPDVSLLISGVDPSPRVRQLAEQDPLITVTGWVMDIRTSYGSARVFVAPMQIGTGLQNKFLEAMAMRMPCITSALANNAERAEPGKCILNGQSPDDYATHILRLLDDPGERDRLAQAGYDFVRDRFNWDRSAADLERLLVSGSGMVLGQPPGAQCPTFAPQLHRMRNTFDTIEAAIADIKSRQSGHRGG